jgi:CheY-like chemotaxis protein
MLRRTISTLLSEAAEIHEAADGEEAVRRALELQPAVIFMDRRMPVMEGDEATRRLRAAGFEQPIFGVTGDALPTDVSAFRDAGGDRRAGQACEQGAAGQDAQPVWPPATLVARCRHLRERVACWRRCTIGLASPAARAVDRHQLSLAQRRS